MSFPTDEFITGILKRENPVANVKILDRKTVDKIPELGQNFSSKISIVNVNYESDGKKFEKRLIVKVPYQVPHYGKLRDEKIYEREISLYETVLENFQTVLPEEKVAASYYGTDGKDAVVLEDLSQSGYSTKNRHELLDFQHCAIAFKTLATFHALSVQLHRSKPEILEKIEKNLFSKIDQSDGQMQSQYENAFLKILDRTDPEYTKAHADTLSYLKAQLVRSATEDVSPKDGSVNVLTHGEFWNNNIVFKYDRYGRVLDAKLVDFQFCRWSSPALDIIQFASTSMQFEIFEKYFDLLLEIYVETFNAILSFLKIDCTLSLSDLKNDIVSKYNFWIFSLISTAPAYFGNSENDARYFFQEKFLDEEFYEKHSKSWFSYFIEQGKFTREVRLKFL